MRRWLTIVAVAALMAAAMALTVAFPVSDVISRLVQVIRDAGAVGVVLYAAVYVAFTVLLIPGSLLTAGAGLVYGPWLGTLVVSPVSVVAATLAFLLGRTAARGWVSGRIQRDARFAAIDDAIGRRGFRIVLLLRLSPLFPFNLLNYALGVTGVRLRDYVLGSFVGMLPATFLYVYLGSLVSGVAALSDGHRGGGPTTRYLSWAGLVATAAVTVYITRVARAALQAELSRPAPQASPQEGAE